MALAPPFSLDAVVFSPYGINLDWQNGIGADYNFIQIWRKEFDDVGENWGEWAKIETIGGNNESYEDFGLTPNTLYAYHVIGVTIEPPEESDPSNEDSERTWDVLADPDSLVVTAFSNFIELTWRDKSATEDDFCIYREVNGGGFPTQPNPTYTVPANMDYYRDKTGITPGSTYNYKVAARQGDSYSDGYSNEDSAVALSVPPDPASLAISDIKDKSMRLTWAGAWEGQWRLSTLYLVNNSIKNTDKYICIAEHTSEAAREPGVGADWNDYWRLITGYKILISDDGNFTGEELTREIDAGIVTFLVTGLDVSSRYWFRVYAYNGVGDSGYDAADDWTVAAYVPTEFEKWIRDPDIEPVYSAEIYTKMDLLGFTLESGVTWKQTIPASDRGIDILEVFEGLEAAVPTLSTYISYTKQTSIATVEANASSFWFDYDNRILYIHTSDGTNPNLAKFLIEGAFWLYFSTGKDIEFTVHGRLQHFLNLLSTEDIPDITQEIKSCFEGNFGLGSGSIAFKNGKIGGEYFFDKKFATYTWINAKVIVKEGSKAEPVFTYAQFKEIFTGYIDSKDCNDRKITFQLRDIRQEMEQKLVLKRYNKVDFPAIDEEEFKGDDPIPICFGQKDKVLPACVDKDDRKFNYHDGRSKSVLSVEKDKTPLTEDTHYYVDLQRSIITFKRDDFSLEEANKIEVTFIGKVNSADEPIVNHAEVFKYIMNTYRGIADAELNLDSIYESKYANEDALSVFIYADTPYDEIIRNIEHSGRSFTFQDVQGKLGIRPQQTIVASNVKYVISDHIFSHSQNKDKSSLFWKVNVDYSEDSQSQKWKTETAIKNEIWWRFKVTKELDIKTYIYGPDDAGSLATTILTLLNKEQIEGELPMLLFDVMAGDLIKFSRTRFYNSDGTASEITLRVLRISKSPASGRTSILAEVVT